MKNRIIICSIVIATLSLAAFSAMSCKESKTEQHITLEKKDVALNTNALEKINKRTFPDFIYDIGPRYNTIKKADLDTLKSFSDIIGEEHANRIVDYKSVSVIIMKDDKQTEIRETGNSDVFTAAQLKLIQSLDYSTNLVIWADYQGKNKETGALEDTHWTPYLTIVPEKQAEYVDDQQELINGDGKTALKEFLKTNSLEARTKAKVIAEKLKPAKLYFTVSKMGTIENVRLDRSSNYPIVDEAMIELIKNTPGQWRPAENINGEKVDQELVVSFGLMGC